MNIHREEKVVYRLDLSDAEAVTLYEALLAYRPPDNFNYEIADEMCWRLGDELREEAV